MAAAPDSASRDYSFIDRLLHRIAFAHPHIQRALGELESDVFASRLKDVSAAAPVFVTGLPRAGTTLLLEFLYSTGEFTTFTYRHMPFLLAPILWAQISAPFRKPGEKRERAHGDAMEISFDSPEAFEEVAWLAFLRERYVEERRVLPIGADRLTDEFRSAFQDLVRKLTAADPSGAAPKRYLSKNNANIGRLEALRSLFPDAAVFVCFREPAAHIRSLITQHERFLAMHRNDAFARSYMAWIGHFDFGANFRPIDFAGRGGIADRAALPAEFWLRYWVDAYSHVEKELAPATHLFCYEKLFENPLNLLAEVGRAAGVKNLQTLTAKAVSIRAPTTESGAPPDAPRDLIAAAAALYGRLRERSLG